MGIEIHTNPKSGIQNGKTAVTEQSAKDLLLYSKHENPKISAAAKQLPGKSRNAKAGISKPLLSSLFHPLLSTGASTAAEAPPSYEQAMRDAELDRAAEDACNFLRQSRAQASESATGDAPATDAGDDEDNGATGTSIVHTTAGKRPDFLEKDLQELSAADFQRAFEANQMPPEPVGRKIQDQPKPEDLIYMLTEKLKDNSSRGYSRSSSYDKRYPSALQGKIGKAFAGLAGEAAYQANAKSKKKMKPIRAKEWGPPAPKYVPLPPPELRTLEQESDPPAPNYIPEPPPKTRHRK